GAPLPFVPAGGPHPGRLKPRELGDDVGGAGPQTREPPGRPARRRGAGGPPRGGRLAVPPRPGPGLAADLLRRRLRRGPDGGPDGRRHRRTPGDGVRPAGRPAAAVRPVHRHRRHRPRPPLPLAPPPPPPPPPPHLHPPP